MHLRAVCLGPAVLICSFSLNAYCQEIGNVRDGYRFAVKHCSECHAVDPGNAQSPHPGAPNFTSVAKTSGMTGRALAAWLDTSHPTMPNLVLHTADRDDVVAYIMSLKGVPASK